MAAKRVKIPFCTDSRRKTIVFVSSHVPQECAQYAVPSSHYPKFVENYRNLSKINENRRYSLGNRYIVSTSCIMCWRCCERGHMRHECTALVGFHQKDTDIPFQVKMDAATIPPSLLRTFQVVANTLRWILE